MNSDQLAALLMLLADLRLQLSMQGQRILELESELAAARNTDEARR
jgi:hypothetical protein